MLDDDYFKNNLKFRKSPKIVNEHYQTYSNSKKILFSYKKSLFTIGNILTSSIFILFLFSMQSFMLRQNIDYKKRKFISD